MKKNLIAKIISIVLIVILCVGIICLLFLPNLYDIFKDKANLNRIWLGNKSQTVWHDTGYYIDDLLTYFGGI